MWAEDVRDIIATISPHEVPNTNMWPDFEISTLKYEWPLKRLNVVKANYTASTVGVKQRAETNPEHVSADVDRPPRVMVDSHMQNFSEDVEISDRLAKVRGFGVADEFSLQSADAAMEVAKEYEAWMVLDTFTPFANTGALGTAAEPTRMRPLMEQALQARLAGELNFAPNLFSGQVANFGLRLDNGGSKTAPWDGVGVSAQDRFNEALLLKVMELMQGTRDTGGSSPDVVELPPANYIQAGNIGNLSSFSGVPGSIGGNVQYNIDPRLKRIYRGVRIADTQAGIIAFVRNRWLQQANNTGAATTATRRTNTFAPSAAEIGVGMFFERKFMSHAFLIPFTFERFMRTSLSRKGTVSGDGTPVVGHPQAIGFVYGINNV